MTWTYNGNPAGSKCDAVRFLSGDVDTTDQQVTDEEIGFVIEREGDPNLAAAAICEHIATKLSRKADQTVGPSSEQCSQKATAYAERAEELRNRASIRAAPVLGVQTVSGKQALNEDTGAIQPNFQIGMSDNPTAPANPTNAGEEDLRRQG